MLSGWVVGERSVSLEATGLQFIPLAERPRPTLLRAAARNAVFCNTDNGYG